MSKSKKAPSYEEAKDFLRSLSPNAFASLSIREFKAAMGEGSLGTYSDYKNRYELEVLHGGGTTSLIASIKHQLDAHNKIVGSLLLQLEMHFDRAPEQDPAAPAVEHDYDRSEEVYGWGPVVDAKEVGPHEPAPPRPFYPIKHEWWHDDDTDPRAYDAEMAAIARGSVARFLDDHQDPIERSKSAMEAEAGRNLGAASDTEASIVQGQELAEADATVAGGVLFVSQDEATPALAASVAPVLKAAQPPGTASADVLGSDIDPSPSRSQGAASADASATPRSNADEPHEGDPSQDGWSANV